MQAERTGPTGEKGAGARPDISFENRAVGEREGLQHGT